jgi:sugar lactone lactonase YvrE
MKHALLYFSAGTLLLALGACSKGGSSNTTAKQANVTTVAGSGSTGYGDGTGSSALFNQPAGLAIDASGNLYVADEGNNCIRKVTPSGMVTTLAGSTTPGYKNGQGAAAEFFSPNGIAVDAAGNVYVTDVLNEAIRKITPSGSVTTLAGGTEGSADGTGSAAQFDYPYGITIDGSGNLIVADAYNNRIRKVTPAGVVTTIAGSGATGAGNGGFADGPVVSAVFKAPYGVAVDASGNIYVTDGGNNRIRKISSGNVTTVAGDGSTGYQDGALNSAEFAAPQGLVVDRSGNIYVTEYLSNVREISGGVVTTIAGSTQGTSGFQDGIGTDARFNGTNGIVMDPSGNLYVVDQYNSAIRKITFQ